MAQVLIVSNRLPISVKKVDGILEFSASIGGLATGLGSYVKNKRNKWIGWPGITSDELTEADKQLIIKRLAKDNYSPVFLTRKQVDEFYNGYSNALLWPLFHSLTYREPEKHKQWWQAYRQVNQHFTEAVLNLATTDSHVWVHDYQLLLMPKQIRAERPELQVGFFLHIPFPPPKVFSKLSEGKKLLRGMLGADLIGFHTPGYVSDFLENCQAASLGIAEENQLILPARSVQVIDFPMGIDYEKFASARKLPAVKQAVQRYKKKYKGKKVIAAVDRLDISKGFLERLSAYREFLEQNKKFHNKVVFVLVGAPSRTEIDTYQRLGIKVEKLAADINLAFGSPRWQPVDYINYSIPFEEVTALFQMADVAFIAPIRDGMNLVAKEFVASSRKHGVLILSETAGAAAELSQALLVNPRKPESSVAALLQALTMPKRELKARLTSMQKHLSANTVHDWAGTFVQTLQQPLPGTPHLTRSLTKQLQAAVSKDFMESQSRLLLLDYDGSLVPFTEDYADARPPKSLLTELKKLGADKRNEVVIISGRSSSDLEKWFGKLPVNLVAEHGATMKQAGKQSWQLLETAKTTWKARVIAVLERYTALTPDASIEIKNHSVVWHYRQSPPYYAQKYSVVIKHALKPILKTYGLEIRQGNKVLEIKNPHITKGIAAGHWLKSHPEFIMAVGDDFTDEDMFEILPLRGYSIKVGPGRTRARFRVKSSEQIESLLSQLAS